MYQPAGLVMSRRRVGLLPHSANDNKQKRLTLSKDEARIILIASARLAGDGRNVFNFCRFRSGVSFDRFHAGGVERLLVAAVALALAG